MKCAKESNMDSVIVLTDFEEIISYIESMKGFQGYLFVHVSLEKEKGFIRLDEPGFSEGKAGAKSFGFDFDRIIDFDFFALCDEPLIVDIIEKGKHDNEICFHHMSGWLKVRAQRFKLERDY